MFAGDANDKELVGEIEAGGRFVEEEVAGAAVAGCGSDLNEGAGEMDALLLAAGEGRGVAGGEAREADAIESLPDKLARARRADVGGSPRRTTSSTRKAKATLTD